jgi:hypothetical protein
MIPAYSLAEIEKLKPCSEAWNEVKALKLGKGKLTAKDAVKAGVSRDDLVWVASAIATGKDKTSLDMKFRLTGWMTDVAAHVLHIFENEYPNDDGPRKAIEASQQFIRGNITEQEWAVRAARAARAALAAEAARAAWAALAAEAARAAWAADAADAAWAARAADAALAAEAARAADAALAAEAAEAARAAWAAWAARAAWAADAAEAAWAAWAAEAAEQQWQLDRLVYWLSEDRPKFLPLPGKA